jgi:hypothetical protein
MGWLFTPTNCLSAHCFAPRRTRSSTPPPSHARRWEEKPLPAHSWNSFLDAKRKELQRLNGAYKNTLKNAGVGGAQRQQSAGTIPQLDSMLLHAELVHALRSLVFVCSECTLQRIPATLGCCP